MFIAGSHSIIQSVNSEITRVSEEGAGVEYSAVANVSDFRLGRRRVSGSRVSALSASLQST